MRIRVSLTFDIGRKEPRPIPTAAGDEPGFHPDLDSSTALAEPSRIGFYVDPGDEEQGWKLRS